MAKKRREEYTTTLTKVKALQAWARGRKGRRLYEELRKGKMARIICAWMKKSVLARKVEAWIMDAFSAALCEETSTLSSLLNCDSAYYAPLREFQGELCNTRDRMDGMKTLLHVAAINGNEEAVRMLIGSGADVRAVDCEGNTPLIRSAGCGDINLTVSKLLVENCGGAERDVRSLVACANNDNLTALDVALAEGAEQGEENFAKTIKLLLASGASSSTLSDEGGGEDYEKFIEDEHNKKREHLKRVEQEKLEADRQERELDPHFQLLKMQSVENENKKEDKSRKSEEKKGQEDEDESRINPKWPSTWTEMTEGSSTIDEAPKQRDKVVKHDEKANKAQSKRRRGAQAAWASLQESSADDGAGEGSLKAAPSSPTALNSDDAKCYARTLARLTQLIQGAATDSTSNTRRAGWYVKVKDSCEEGPFSNESMRDRLAAKLISASTQVRFCEGNHFVPLDTLIPDCEGAAIVKEAGYRNPFDLCWNTELNCSASLLKTLRGLQQS